MTALRFLLAFFLSAFRFAYDDSNVSNLSSRVARRCLQLLRELAAEGESSRTVGAEVIAWVAKDDWPTFDEACVDWIPWFSPEAAKGRHPETIAARLVAVEAWGAILNSSLQLPGSSSVARSLLLLTAARLRPQAASQRSSLEQLIQSWWDKNMPFRAISLRVAWHEWASLLLFNVICVHEPGALAAFASTVEVVEWLQQLLRRSTLWTAARSEADEYDGLEPTVSVIDDVDRDDLGSVYETLRSLPTRLPQTSVPLSWMTPLLRQTMGTALRYCVGQGNRHLVTRVEWWRLAAAWVQVRDCNAAYCPRSPAFAAVCPSRLPAALRYAQQSRGGGGQASLDRAWAALGVGLERDPETRLWNPVVKAIRSDPEHADRIAEAAWPVLTDVPSATTGPESLGNQPMPWEVVPWEVVPWEVVMAVGWNCASLQCCAAALAGVAAAWERATARIPLADGEERAWEGRFGRRVQAVAAVLVELTRRRLGGLKREAAQWEDTLVQVVLRLLGAWTNDPIAVRILLTVDVGDAHFDLPDSEAGADAGADASLAPPRKRPRSVAASRLEPESRGDARETSVSAVPLLPCVVACGWRSWQAPITSRNTVLCLSLLIESVSSAAQQGSTPATVRMLQHALRHPAPIDPTTLQTAGPALWKPSRRASSLSPARPHLGGRRRQVEESATDATAARPETTTHLPTTLQAWLWLGCLPCSREASDSDRRARQDAVRETVGALASLARLAGQSKLRSVDDTLADPTTRLLPALVRAIPLLLSISVDDEQRTPDKAPVWGLPEKDPDKEVWDAVVHMVDVLAAPLRTPCFGQMLAQGPALETFVRPWLDWLTRVADRFPACLPQVFPAYLRLARLFTRERVLDQEMRTSGFSALCVRLQRADSRIGLN